MRHALNDISSVFDLQSPTTKNGFCRMFIREGLLDPLSHALGTANGETKKKVIQIFLMFSQVSQSDIHVRNALGTRKVVRSKLICYVVLDAFIDHVFFFFSFAGIMRACELLGAIKENQDEPEGLTQMECLVQLLKAVKHLSMNATLHEVLQNANSLEILISVLEQQSSGPHSTVIPSFLLFLVLTYLSPDAGNFQPCFPNLLQPLSPQQIASGRSSTGRHYPMPQTGNRDELASQAIRITHPLRPRKCREELSILVVATRWSYNVHQTHG